METLNRNGGRHPIGVVVDRTGLTADVLRVWERRYSAVTPERDDAGQRLYSDADIERLRLLRQAAMAGRAIGQIAGLPTGTLERMVAEDAAERARVPASAPAPDERDIVEAAVAHARAFEDAALERRLLRALGTSGLTRFLEGIVAPMLRRFGDEWHAGRLTAAQEHLATAIVRRVVATAMRDVGSTADGPTIVIATPQGERHETGAMLAAAGAAAVGWRVIYLGADLPAVDIATAVRETGAAAVGLSVLYLVNPEATIEELRVLRRALPPDVPVAAGGAGAVQLADALRPAGVEVFAGLDAFGDLLRRVQEDA